jgi:hypothetical protein
MAAKDISFADIVKNLDKEKYELCIFMLHAIQTIIHFLKQGFLRKRILIFS